MACFSSAAIELIKSFEGFSASAYPDPGTGGEPWTIGHGRAHGVKPWDVITVERAEEMLVEDLETAVAALDLVEVELPQSVVDALTSFVFNIGEAAFAASSLLRRLNAGEPIGPVLEQELPRWNKGGNGVLPGLVRRRAAELKLALSGLEHRPAASTGRILNVRAQHQHDNGAEGYRQCFTSACAMLLDTLQPGVLSEINGDLDYLLAVERYGDTTDPQAQVQALRSFGVVCDFITTGCFALIEQQITRGFPVPVGWLHHGHVSAPSGGGHWSTVIGFEEDRLVVHDPNGEAALIPGGYVSNAVGSGAGVRYSRRNFGPRWMVEGANSGWMILAKGSES